MAVPQDFPGTNLLLTVAPENAHNVDPMRTYTNGLHIVSCWQLSPLELQQVIAQGGRVYLALMCGGSPPPVLVGSEDTVRAHISDYGVWRR